MLLATVQNEEDSPPPLDPNIAPVLLFDEDDYDDDDDNNSAGEDDHSSAVEDDDDNHDNDAGETSHARYLYSIPSRRVLQHAVGSFIMNKNWVTPQGWVLTLVNEDGSRDVSLRDPFSPRAVQLPPDRECFLDSDTTKCILSTHRPTDPGCIVLVAHKEDPVLFYCRPGDSRWSRHEYQPELLCDGRLSAIRAMSLLTAAGGMLYGYIFAGRKIVTLNFSPEPIVTVTHVAEKPLPPRCNARKDYLVESCEELFVVRFSYRTPDLHKIMQIEVDKLDRLKWVWVKVADLGVNRVFFIGDSQFGVSMEADVLGSKPNCIYFTKFDDKGLHVYDMEQGSTTLHNPALDVPNCTEPILLMSVQ